MNKHPLILAAFLAIVTGILLPSSSHVWAADDIKLLQPLPGGTTTLSGSGVQLFFNYFNAIWPWVLSIAGGVAVLNGVIGGTMIMMSGSDSGMESAGKDKLKYSIAGLIMIAFAGTILRILNPTFYQ